MEVPEFVQTNLLTKAILLLSTLVMTSTCPSTCPSPSTCPAPAPAPAAEPEAPAPAPDPCSDDNILKSPSQSSSSDAKSLAAAEAYCTARSMEVCTYASICPGGDESTPKLGANPSDSWVVTKNGEWVQTSDLRPERLCRTHKSYLIDAGHTTEEAYVAEDWVEGWMADVVKSLKREVYCCTSGYNACTGGSTAPAPAPAPAPEPSADVYCSGTSTGGPSCSDLHFATVSVAGKNGIELTVILLFAKTSVAHSIPAYLQKHR